MKNEPVKKNGMPLMIIGSVLVLAVLLGGWYYFTTKTPTSTNATNGSQTANGTPKPVKAATIPPDAPRGADPPNQSGSPTAHVTVEEFADFQCPQCGMKHPVMNEIKSIYGSRIHFIFRNYPLAMHDKSYDAAVAAEAAGLQNPNKFWEMQNMLFTNQKVWTADPNYKQIWKGYAQTIGLDVPKWENDMAGIQAKGRVDADLARVKAIGVNSTPTLYVNGTLIEFKDMDVDPLKRIIDAELQKTAPQSQAGNPAAAPSNAASTKQ